MTFGHAIDDYIADARAYGAINSPHTEQRYRHVLGKHCEDVSNRDPAKTGRTDVKRTLARYENPNSRRQAHAILTSFYDWTAEEEIRDSNPARMVRRAKARPVNVYRPTREECVRLMVAAKPGRERRVIYFGLLAGLRRQELCGLQQRHLATKDWIWVSGDIAKGGRERWVPVLPELELVVADFLLTAEGPLEYVIPSIRVKNVDNSEWKAIDAPMSPAGMYQIVRRIGRRAGLGQEIGTHTLRHAFGDHVARVAGLKAAQAVMGHASVATTESVYTARMTRDEIEVALRGLRYGANSTPQPLILPEGSHNVEADVPRAQSQKEDT